MSASRPPFHDDYSRVGSLRKARTESNTAQNRQPFKVKPLNESTLPRYRFTERSLPQSRLHRLDKCDDPNAVLKRYKEKSLNEERERRRGLKDRYKWKPQIGLADEQSETGASCSLSNIKSAEPQMLRGLFPSVEVSLNSETLDAINNGADTIDSAAQTLSNLVSNLKDISQQVAPNGKIEVETRLDKSIAQSIVNLSEFAIIVVVVCLVIMLKPKTHVERALVMTLLLGIAASRVDIQKLFDASGFLNWFRAPAPSGDAENKAKPEIFDISQDDITTVVTSLINIYVLQSFGSEIMDPKKLLSVTSQISRMSPTVQNITAGVTLLTTFLSTMFRRALGTEGFVRTGTAYIDGFLQEYEDIIDQFERKELHMRQTSVDRVKACIKYGHSVATSLPGSPSKYVVIRMQVMQSIAQLEKIRSKLMSSNFLYTGHRQEPACLLLMGKPGVFKSQAMQHICNAVNALTLPDEQFERFKESPTTSTYSYQHENVYHEGYSQEKNVTLIDDFGQAKDIAGNPDNEFMNLIRMVNIFENILHMAGIENKGNTHFRSKFVIANSNLFTFSPESINDRMAILRRFHIAVIVRPRKEFCVDPDAPPLERKFDPKTFPVFTEETCRGNTHLIGHTRTHPDMCEFDLQCVLPNGTFTSTGTILSFEELIKLYHEKYLWTQRNHEAYKVTLEDTLDQFRSVEQVEPQMARIRSDEERRQIIQTRLTQLRRECFRHDSFVEYEFVSADADVFERSYYSLDGPGESGAPIHLSEYVLDTSREFVNSHLFEGEEDYHPYIQSLISFIFNFLEVDGTGADALKVISTRLEEYYERFHGIDMWCRMDPNRHIMELNVVEAIEATFYCTTVLESADCDFADHHASLWPIESRSDHSCKAKIWFTVTLEEPLGPFVHRDWGNDPETDSWGDRPAPQMDRTPWQSSSSVDIAEMTQPRVKPRFGRYSLEKSRDKRLSAYRLNDWSKWSAFDQVILTLALTRRSERDEILDLNDLFDTMEAMDFDIFRGEDGGVDIPSFLSAVEVAYDERPPPQAYRPNLSLIRSHLAEARSSATDIQKRIWSLYNICVSYLIQGTQGIGDALCSSLVESPTLRARIGIFVGGLAGFATAIKAAQFFMRGIFPSSPESDERGNRVGRSQRRRAVKRNPKQPPYVPHSLATQNKNVCNVIEMISANSMYEIHLPLDPEEAEDTGKTHFKAGYGLALRGQCVLMPWHFWSQAYSDLVDHQVIERDAHVIFKRMNGVVAMVITIEEFVQGGVMWQNGDDNDLILIRMPKRWQPAKNLVGHFAPSKQHDKYTKVNACLVIPGVRKDIWNVVVAQQDRDVVVGDDRFEDYTIKNPYSYAASTSNGDCGSLLYADDKQHSASLIGMHVAGVSNLRKGISAKITREFLEEYLKFADENYEVEPLGIGENKLVIEPTTEVIANQITLGRATPESAVPSRMTKTALVPSPLKDSYFESPKTPSALWRVKVNGEIIDPLKIAREEYCPGTLYIPQKIVDAARESLLDWLLHNSDSDTDVRRLTFKEAVLGIPGEKILSIPRKTSSGYPYNCTVRPANKTYFFGDGDDFDLTRPEAIALEQEVERCIDLMKRNIRPNFVFTDSLKDEKRPKEKVALGKTRMFSGCPIVYTLLCRMYFGRFAEWIINNRIDNGIAIGVNQYSSEWDHAARKLNQFGTGPNKGAGDFKSLDKNHLAQIQQASLDLINDWYTLKGSSREENQIRTMLGLDLVNSLHVNEGLFTYWQGATPSGHFLTALVNSLDVHLYFRMSWIDLIRPKTFDAHEFNDVAYLLVLGDDNVFAVDSRYSHIFTEAALGPSMKKWNQTYTPESDKGGDLSNVLRPLEEIGFLKRKWVYDKSVSRYLAPLDLNTVLDIPNWIKKGGNAIGDTETNLDNCLAELALHGKEVYDYWWQKIYAAIQKVPGLSTPKITSYRLRLADTLRRDGTPFLMTRPLTDYDEEWDNTPVIKPELGRFGGQGGALFRVIARKPRWRSHQIPSTRERPQRLARCVASIGAATIVDEIGDSSNGRTIVEQVEDGTSLLGGGTTHSTVDAGVVSGKIQYKPISAALLESAKTDVSNEIRAFLAKPRFIQAGNLSTTDTFAVPIWSAWIPSDFINGAGGIWQNKLEGTLAFRGTVHVTVSVNGNRFQQGRYILSVVPTGGCANNNDVFRALHSATLTEVTQLPHVELDVNCDTEMTLEIPMVSSSGWVPIMNTSATPLYGAVGWVSLRAYSPLVAPAGSSTASYTIFARMTDVEFAMPTIPQSGRRPKGRVVRRRPADIEAKSADIGPIESGAATVSLAAKMLTGVPLLSSIAAPVSWVSDLVRNAASAYGWSRPRNEGATQYVMKQIMHRAGNVDAPDNSTKLALFDRNELGDMPDFAGSVVDEMAIQYLATISAYTSQYVWNSSTHIPGTTLFRQQLSPRVLYNTTSLASQSVSHLTPLAMLSTYFCQWRGGFRMTVKFVKTEFHSGRLAVVFMPNTSPMSDTLPLIGLSNSQFLHREIIDIRMGNEFTIEFPYFGFTQYRPCSTASPAYYSGTIQVFVINSLVAPANVSSNVTMLVEWSGTPDFEFAQPANPTGVPVVQMSPQIGRYTPQIGRSDCEMVATSVGHASEGHPAIAAEACIGEKVLSLRSMLKKFSQVKLSVDPGSTANRYCNVSPFGVSVGQINTVPTYIPGPVRPDMFDRIAVMYAFYRGGMRYKFINSDRTHDMTLTACSLYQEGTNNALNFTGVYADVDQLNRPFSWARGDAQGACEVEFPFYSSVPMMCVGDFLVNPNATTPTITIQAGSFGPKVAGYCYTNDTSSTTRPPVTVYRAMAEDGSLGMFVSTVPIVGYSPSQFY